MQNASQLGQNSPVEREDMHQDHRFSAHDCSAQTSQTCQLQQQLVQGDNYLSATGLRANFLQGSKRTQRMAVTFSQPQPGPNKMQKRLECITRAHTVLPEKLTDPT